MCFAPGRRLPEALFMVSRLDSKGAKENQYDKFCLTTAQRGNNAKKIRENTNVEAAPLPGLGEAAREVLAHGLKEAARTMPRARHAQTHVRDACRRSLWKWIRDSEC